MHEFFRKFAAEVSKIVGSIWTFLVVISVVLATGYYFNFSNEWKTNVNFVITLTALLVLFILQKSQNHSDRATHLKLDELINAVEGARNEVAAVENRAEEHIDILKNNL
jgi:low affinity Fe/Cu permease